MGEERRDLICKKERTPPPYTPQGCECSTKVQGKQLKKALKDELYSFSAAEHKRLEKIEASHVKNKEILKDV
jgi:hypothetical protein